MDEKKRLTLLSLPLLQGISALDMSHILLEEVNTQEVTLNDGDILVSQGDVCQHLIFLVEGTLEATTVYHHKSYSFVEFLIGPLVIEPDILYGIQRHFQSSYAAMGSCRLLLIPKGDVNRKLFKIDVFRLNYLNLLSTLAVRRREYALPLPTPDLKARVSNFFARHSMQASGRMIFNIRMRDMAQYLDASRVLISNALHQLEDEGLLVLNRTYIEIPLVERLNRQENEYV